MSSSNKSLFSTHQLLMAVKKREWPSRLSQAFPFNLTFIQNMDELFFEKPVTFLVGENGTGKSTLLESIACAARLPTIGSQNIDRDPTLEAARLFAKYLRLSWSKKKHRGFFLRAEDFFGFTKRSAQTQQELNRDLDAVDVEYADRSDFAKSQARMAYANELSSLKNRYGEGLDSQSHGESFLKLFQARFVPEGLYLLDEPEAPLSPLRQLSFLAILKNMIDDESQFIIATHSPIIMAFPDADIWSFDQGYIHQVKYDDLEHVNLTRTFLNNPESYLNHLWDQHETD
jgi:predicted ATPase